MALSILLEVKTFNLFLRELILIIMARLGRLDWISGAVKVIVH